MLYFDKQTDSFRIAVWHIVESLDELLSMLPDEDTVRQELQQRFHSTSRQLEWTAVRVLLYTMLGRQVPILYHDNGAPDLPKDEQMDISISHTRGYAAVALTTSGVIGIDIEQISNRVERVKSRFVRDDESAETITSMLLHWSAKETAYKMLHRTNVDFLQHLSIQPFPEQEEGTLLLRETRTDDKRTLSVNYKVFPDFVLTYSS